MNTIIGHTGFVGKNLNNQIEFDHTYNTKNINEINLISHDNVYCCGVSSNKRWANNNEIEDRKNIEELLKSLKNLNCNRFILISTIDVYIDINDKNEDDLEYNHNNHPYGKNRHFLELELRKLFKEKLKIIRLPAVFGEFLKKNVLFDLVNNIHYGKINTANMLQWYHIDDLREDILFMENNNIEELNLFTEPISMKELIDNFFVLNQDLTYHNEDDAIMYTLKTKHKNDGYWESKNVILKKIERWLKKF